MARERRDDDLTEADRQVMRLYDDTKKPIDWDESDDAILALSRKIHAKGGKETTAPATEAKDGGAVAGAHEETGTVVPFAPQQRSFVHRVIHSPAMGFSLAASLMIGVFSGQVIMPYVDFGVSPGYDDVVRDNKRLQQELNQSQNLLTRSLSAHGGTAAQPAGSIMQLTQALSGFDCASLSATLSKDMKITVSGYVSSDADLLQLGEKLAGLDRTAAVVNQAMVAGKPACEVLELLHQKAGADAGLPTVPVIRPYQHGAAYVAHEKLVVEAEATSLYDGYLYVDFVQHDGTVLHMLPGPDRTANAVKAGERVRLGDGAQEYTVAPPYGTEMLAVISSPVPLFDKARPQIEPAKEYLGALRRALETAGKRNDLPKIVSNYQFIKTGPESAAGGGK